MLADLKPRFVGGALMGAWGIGPFDNDDAGDLLAELAGMNGLGRAQRVKTALILPDGYLGVDSGSMAIAAAALVAAASGMPLDGPVEAEELIRSGTIPSDDEIRAHTRAALARVNTDESEWHELWAEADSLAEVEGTLTNIRLSL
jgi:hypothetical protein